MNVDVNVVGDGDGAGANPMFPAVASSEESVGVAVADPVHANDQVNDSEWLGRV